MATKQTRKRQNIIQNEPANLDQVLAYAEGHHKLQVKNVQEGRELLPLGVKTEVVQFWEGIANNPMNALMDTVDFMDDRMNTVITDFVKDYLISKKSLIATALKSDTGNKDLHFCIALKKDSLTNRMKINEFFSHYYGVRISTKYPVYFQFVPKEVVDKLKVAEKIM